MQQIQHCIFMASNYANNKRKGLHYLVNETNINNVLELLKEFETSDGVSPYFITTNSVSYDSIQEKDPFFKGVILFEGTEKNAIQNFKKAITNQINSFDIAVLFLSRNQISFKRLKMLMCLFYIVYLDEHEKSPIVDMPVIKNKDIFFKKFSEEFEKRNNNNKIVEDSILKSNKEEIVFSKFLNSDGGFDLLNNSLTIYFNLNKLDDSKMEYFCDSFVMHWNNLIKSKKTTGNINKFVVKEFFKSYKI